MVEYNEENNFFLSVDNFGVKQFSDTDADYLLNTLKK